MLGRIALLEALSLGRPVAAAKKWPRYILDEAAWRGLIAQMAVADWVLLAEWGGRDEVHAALRDDLTGDIAIATRACPDRRFHAIGPVRPGAARLERAIRDLWGLAPEGLEDQRHWLDHGNWPVSPPLAPSPSPAPVGPYRFLSAEGEGLHQVPVGPVHAGIIEPGHFRFHIQGETVVRLEARLGYVHKGVAAAMAGRTVAAAARVAGRVSGDSTVAYALAYAHAVEDATGCAVPPRAVWLRAILAETERIANHVFDIGAICNDAAFPLALSEASLLRESLLQTNETLFGHRLAMDCVIPGGTAIDLDAGGVAVLARTLAHFGKRFRRLTALYHETASLLDRTTGTGIVGGALVHRFGAGGFVGRAASRGHDARKVPGYPPYDQLDVTVPVRAEGDVNARVEIRIAEIEISLGLINRLLAGLPAGPVVAAVPLCAGEGLGMVEGFRGKVLVWVRLTGDGTVSDSHTHDPSWFQWPLLEAAIEGNILADFPLCNKSFNCSYSGVDL
jgi:Ni,Fe-hydrogenase III large subunit